MPELPVTTIGGFLGAGKTTLVNAMLRGAQGRRLAVLVNEFGALPIDADLIEAQDGNMISIAGGCVCCSFGDDLLLGLRNLQALDPPPDQILIEASGVAIPSSIAFSIALVPGFRQNGVIVLADAETVQATAGDKYLGDTILRQLQDADLVIATKADLVDAPALETLSKWLSQASGGARVLATSQGQVPLDVILEPMGTADLATSGPHSDALFKSMVLPCQEPVDAAALAAALAKGQLGVLRAKGHVRDFDGQLHLIQVIGRRSEVSPAVVGASHGIVCIGLAAQFDEAALLNLTQALQMSV